MNRCSKRVIPSIAAAGISLVALSACSPNADFRMRMWESFISSGMSEEMHNRPEHARTAFEAALQQLSGIEDNQRRVETLVRLGWADLETGNGEQALVRYRQAAALSESVVAKANPGFKSYALLLQARSMLGLGEALFRVNRVEESLQWFDRAILTYDQASPVNEMGRDSSCRGLAVALLCKGDALYRQGRIADAARMYKCGAYEANATAGALSLRSECLKRFFALAPHEHLPVILHSLYDGLH